MKVRNRLLNFGNSVIYQDDEWFSFSLDSVILSNFVSIRLTDKKILDMACGNAPIPMLLRELRLVFMELIFKKVLLI